MLVWVDVEATRFKEKWRECSDSPGRNGWDWRPQAHKLQREMEIKAEIKVIGINALR